MKKILIGIVMIMSVGILHAQVNNTVIIHIGGQVFTVNGDVDLGIPLNAPQSIQGDSTIIKLPNVTIITNSKKKIKEIYINGGAADFSLGTGNTYMDFRQHLDSMLNNRHLWGMNIPDSEMFQNMPDFSYSWNWGNFPGNMDSMMNFNRNWMDSFNAHNRGGQLPQQYNYNYNWQGNNDSSVTKERLQEKIEDLKEKLNDLQQRLNNLNEKLNEKGGKNNNSYVPEDSTKIRIGNFRILINDNGVRINPKDSGSSCSHEHTIKTHWILLDVGFTTYLSSFSTNLPADQSGLELIQGKSVNVNLQLFQQSVNLYQQHFFFAYGVGFDFYDYRFRQNISLVPKSDVVQIVEAPAQLSKDKLSDTYLAVPVLFQYESCTNYAKSFHVGIGMNVGYLITSHTKQESAGYGKVKVWDSYDLNSFNYGPTLRIGFSWFNLYINYGLNGVFKTGSAPLLNPLSFGISVIAD